jgi:PAS domain S-box-containing protein
MPKRGDPATAVRRPRSRQRQPDAAPNHAAPNHAAPNHASGERAEDQLDRLFSLSQDLLCVVGFDGYLKRVNPAFLATLGYRPEELASQPYVDLAHPDDRAAVSRELERLRKGLTTNVLEVRSRRKNGSYRLLQWNATSALPQQMIYAVGRDITRRRRMQELERQRVRSQLQQAQEGLDASVRQQTAELKKRNHNLALEVDQRKVAEEERNSLLAEREYLARRLLHAEEQERQRLAYDIHDGLLQMIAAADMQVESLHGLKPANQLMDEKLDSLSQQLKLAIQEGRRVLSELHPPALDDFGLPQALRVYLETAAQQAGWSWELDITPKDLRLEPWVESSLFRIIQEAIVNARKHALTRKVKVALRLQRNRLLLQVQDWGQGFDMQEALAKIASGESLGLTIMKERSHRLGGSCDIIGEPGRGTKITAYIPVPAVPL